jgi:hypothetical protein
MTYNTNNNSSTISLLEIKDMDDHYTEMTPKQVIYWPNLVNRKERRRKRRKK